MQILDDLPSSALRYTTPGVGISLSVRRAEDGVSYLVVWALARAFPVSRDWDYPRRYRPEEILNERFARGEITTEEHRDSLRVLREKSGKRSDDGRRLGGKGSV